MALPVVADTQRYPYYVGVGVFALKADMVPERDLRNLFGRFLDSADGGAEPQGQETISWDDAGDGHKVYFGVAASDDWDWEAGYINFGSNSGTIKSRIVNGPFSIATMTTVAEAYGWFGNVQYSPRIFDLLDATIKFGYMRWDGRKKSYFTTIDPPNIPGEFEETISGIDEFFGLGLTYELTERWVIRADLDRYALGEDEIDIFGLSAQLWF
jgi:hypothetical protein